MDDATYLKLKAFFPQVHFEDLDESWFRSLWTAKDFTLYDLITEAGSIEHYFYFVLEGVQALYILNEKGQKVVLGFSYTGSPSGVFDAFWAPFPGGGTAHPFGRATLHHLYATLSGGA